MKYIAELYRLSENFYSKYSQNKEILTKSDRTYNCLLVDLHLDYFICIPYRSHILHDNAFLFHNSERSKRTRSGLDYSKMAIIKDTSLLAGKGVVDKDEYSETKENLPFIVKSAVEYLHGYIKHFQNNMSMVQYKFDKLYGMTALSSFHKELGLQELRFARTNNAHYNGELLYATKRKIFQRWEDNGTVHSLMEHKTENIISGKDLLKKGNSVKISYKDGKGSVLLLDKSQVKEKGQER